MPKKYEIISVIKEFVKPKYDALTTLSLCQ